MPKKKSTVEDSGILTHLKVIDHLRKREWSITVSPYYYDNGTELVKEIDVVAEKQFNSAQFARQSSKQINIQLFVECKYINQEINFWFDALNRQKAVAALEENTGLKILEFRSGADITPDKFHYLREPKAAKLFSANANREDVVYKAVSQCVKAQVYYRQWVAGPIANPFNPHPETKHGIVRYPVVVCDNFSNLKEIEVNPETKEFSTKSIGDSFLLETNYLSFNKDKTTIKDDYFLIDFVNLDSLETYLQTIEDEAKAILSAIDDW